jgi:hypothetical protein
LGLLFRFSIVLNSDLYVGTAAKLLAMGGYCFLRLMHGGTQYLMFRLQRTEEPPRARAQNNLHSAGLGMQERTEIDRLAREAILYMKARASRRCAGAADWRTPSTSRIMESAAIV